MTFRVLLLATVSCLWIMGHAEPALPQDIETPVTDNISANVERLKDLKGFYERFGPELHLAGKAFAVLDKGVEVGQAVEAYINYTKAVQSISDRISEDVRRINAMTEPQDRIEAIGAYLERNGGHLMRYDDIVAISNGGVDVSFRFAKLLIGNLVPMIDAETTGRGKAIAEAMERIDAVMDEVENSEAVVQAAVDEGFDALSDPAALAALRSSLIKRIIKDDNGRYLALTGAEILALHGIPGRTLQEQYDAATVTVDGQHYTLSPKEQQELAAYAAKAGLTGQPANKIYASYQKYLDDEAEFDAWQKELLAKTQEQIKRQEQQKKEHDDLARMVQDPVFKKCIEPEATERQNTIASLNRARNPGALSWFNCGIGASFQYTAPEACCTRLKEDQRNKVGDSWERFQECGWRSRLDGVQKAYDEKWTRCAKNASAR